MYVMQPAKIVEFGEMPDISGMKTNLNYDKNKHHKENNLPGIDG
jgi:hypothetical protein